MRQLLFVHGRAQEGKDADALKREWVDAFKAGLAKSNLDLPIPEHDIRFPYYGQTLYDLVSGASAGQTARVVVRSGRKAAAGQTVPVAVAEEQRDTAELAFAEAVVREICIKRGVLDPPPANSGARVVTRGALNSSWLHRALRVVDRFFPASSDGSIRLFTEDVYRYLHNIGVRDQIEMGVKAALTPGIPTVVVSHSLGTVVSYSLLRRDGASSGWVVPLYVTLGSPLGVTAIRDGLAPNAHPPCVGAWFNAMDTADVVALYPLSREHFPLDPGIENKTDVQNHTPNRHGISGYLDDPVVARRIYDALVA